jgi:molybdate transport system regulatory protein
MKKDLRVRCWIHVDNEKFFGLGRVELLQQVDKTGSLAKAAKSMGMSYKKAWAMVEDLNKRGNKPYVVAHKGGKKGGGAELTTNAKKVIDAYTKMMKQLDAVAKKHSRILKMI